MKKLLKNIHFLALGLGGLGLALRSWMLLDGTDDRGLYPRNHPAWILLLLLWAGSVLGLWLLSRRVAPKRPYRAGFPASSLGAIGCLVGAAGIAIVSIQSLGTQLLASLVGLAACAGLAWAGWLRAKGSKPPFPVYALPAAYLALYVFELGRLLGGEPEISRYLPQLLGALSALLASYHLWGFTVDLGSCPGSLLWSLSAVVLCMSAIPGCADWPLFAGLTVWLITNLCACKPRSRKPRQPEATPEPDAADVLLAEFLQEPEEN